MQQKFCELPPIYDAQDEEAQDQNGAWTADKNERMSLVQVTTERRHCTMCTTVMGGWRVSKRATPEGEEGSAKLAKSGGKGSMKASARSAASSEDTLGKSIVALYKLIQPKTRPGHARACGCIQKLLARAQIVESTGGGNGSGSGRGSGVRGDPHGRGKC